jgi:hypothetical protein
MLFPLYHVLADVGQMRGGRAISSSSDDPLRVDALAMGRGSLTRILLCNMTHTPQSAVLGEISADRVSVRHLNEQTAPMASADGVSFRAGRDAELDVKDGALTLELLPYECARVDVNP